jgi:hypothetical protein
MGVGDLNSQRLKASSARHSKARRGMKASNLQSAAVQSEPFDTDMGNHLAHVGGINRSERARPVLNSRRSMSARSNALNRKSQQEDLEALSATDRV